MQQLPVLGVGRHGHTLQPDLGCARVAADGEEDCVELVHELDALSVLAQRPVLYLLDPDGDPLPDKVEAVVLPIMAALFPSLKTAS